MLAVFADPHSSTTTTSSEEPSSNAGAQSWNKVRAWFSRERGRAGKILQLALIGAARAASSASTNVATPTPQRPAMTNAAAWDGRPEMESRLRETQLTMLEWVNVRRAEEYQKMVDGALPPIPSETEMGSRSHVVKRKPVPSLDSFDDGGVLEPHLHLVKSAGFQDETGHGHDVNCTWRGTFPGSPHDFPDSVSDQEEDSDQDSYDQDMDCTQSDRDSDSEDETLDRGQVVAEMCGRWGWTLQDVLETLEQPGLEGRRKCSREKGVLRA